MLMLPVAGSGFRAHGLGNWRLKVCGYMKNVWNTL